MNEQVVIQIISDTKQFDKAMASTIENIKNGFIAVDDFVEAVNKADGKQLEAIGTSIKKHIVDSKFAIEELNQELARLDSQPFNMAKFEKMGNINKAIEATKEELGVLTSQFNLTKLAMERLKLAGNPLSEASSGAKTLGKNSIGAKLGMMSLSKVMDGARAMSSSLGDSFRRTARRFARGLFIGGFGTLRKSMREAINLNDGARQSFNTLSRVMGTALLPVINAVAKALRTATVWVAGFIKALTGYDLISKAIAVTNKQIAKTGSTASKSAKAVSKALGALAGFDEINNIAQPDSGGGAGDLGIGGAELDTLGGLQSMLDEMNAMDFAWVEKLRNGLLWIKDNWQYVVVALAGITLAITALKVASLLASVGLTGMLTPLLLIALGITGAIAVILGIIEMFKEGGNQTKAWTLILGGLLAIVTAIGIAFGVTAGLIALAIAAVVALALWVVKNWEVVKQWFTDFWNGLVTHTKATWDGIKESISIVTTWIKDTWNGVKTWFRDVFSAIGAFFVDTWDKAKEKARSFATWIKETWQGVKDWFRNIASNIGTYFANLWTKARDGALNAVNRVKSFFTDLRNTISNIVGKIGDYFAGLWNKIKTTFTNIGQKVGDMLSNAIKGAINAVLSVGVSIINKFVDSLNFAIKLINKIPGVKITLLSRMSVPSYDVGTNYVPKDTLANIHKGEAIIPKKFNKEKFFGKNENVDMSETNGLLERIIEAIISLNMDGNDKLTSDDIGRIAVAYIKSQSRLRGGSLV